MKVSIFLVIASTFTSTSDAFTTVPSRQVGRAFATSSRPSATELYFFRRLLGRRRKSGGSSSDTSEEEVRSLFYLWNDALATGDSHIVASRYAKEAVLLPTVSNIPRTDYDGIKDYFDAFLLKKPQGEIVEGFIKIGDGWAQDNGIYEFTMGADGSKVKARYTYVYVKENGKWKISHHHSSVMPEGVLAAAETLRELELATD